MVHAPIPPHYLLPLKGWQLHHSESKIWSHTWQPRTSFFFFFFFAERRNSGILQTSQNSLYFPRCLCSLCCYPLKTQYDLPPLTLCCYFQYKISIQGLLAARCLFFCPSARFLLNTRQIEHFRNWHFSGSICQYPPPSPTSDWKLIHHGCMTMVSISRCSSKRNSCFLPLLCIIFLFIILPLNQC